MKMKSYFSQLAKQSGLRFAEQSGKTRQVKTLPPAPLHEENTILIAPDSPAEKTQKPSLQNALTPLPETPKTSPKPKSKGAETKPVETFTAEKPKPLESFVSSQNIEIASEIHIENYSEIKPVEQKEKKSAELPGVEQIVFKETGFTESLKTPEANPEVSETKLVEAQTNQKEYFKKTGELLETDDADRQEIQQILLQEVHEWVSDTPVFAESENVEVKEPSIKILPPIERETVLVREPFAHQQDEKQGLEEQNFNLSIGTISIVIEEAEKPSPPENIPPKTSGESKTAETKRQFSRLSRNYL